MRRRVLARTLPALALLVLGAGRTVSLAAQDDEREAPEVEKLTFRGVHAVDKGELQKSVATKSSHCNSLVVRVFCAFTKSKLFFTKEYLDRAEFKRDVLRIKVFYWRRGYRDAQVDTTVAKGKRGVRVAFDVVEGLPTRVSSIVLQADGDTVLRSRDIERAMQLRAGEPFSVLALDSSMVLLRNELFEKGYADAEVVQDAVIVDDSLKTAGLRLRYIPNWLTRIGTINVDGEQEVTERTIKNSLTLKTGRIYRRADLLGSQRNLYESNLFRRAAIVIPPEGDSVKSIQISVLEAPMRELRTSGGFNTVDFFQVEQRFTRFNFLGGARRLDVRAVVGNLLASQLNGALIFKNAFSTVRGLSDSEQHPFLLPTWQASVDFNQPWFHGPKNSYGLSVFAHRRSAPAIFIDKGFGASATLTRQMASRASASLNYRYELAEVQAGDVYFCQNFGVCENRTINALRGRQAMAPLALSVFTDRTNDLFFPTGGYVLRGDAEHASGYTLSDFRYNRLAGEANKYFKIGRRMALATRLGGGYVKALGSTAQAVGLGTDAIGETNILHPRKRFYAGGSQSVRGYGENQLGPRVLTVDPAELLKDRVLQDSEGRDSVTITGCTQASVADASCNPISVPSDLFQPRPTGGSSLVEGSIEWRFPLWQQLGGAVFVDGAFVGEGSLANVGKGTGAITPGFGARYYSPAGAIRIDLGIRPRLTERLNVVTQIADVNGERRIVRLANDKFYNPLENSGGFRQVLDRLTLHLSIGQSF